MWMRASEEQLKAGVSAIELENHEGLWMEKPDLFNKYLRRPSQLEEMCLAQFAKMYKGSAAKSEDSEEAFDDENEVDNEEEFQEPTGEEKFHYIMTYRKNGSKGKPLPDLIKLSDPIPGERSTLKKRSFPAALRFHKVKPDDHR